MLSLSVYKVLHIAGAFVLFGALGAVSLGSQERKLIGIAHGLGLVLILVGGFGALARLGVSSPFPLWIWIKLALWLTFGAATVFVRKSPGMAKLLFWLFPVLGAVAAYLALYKPGSGPI